MKKAAASKPAASPELARLVALVKRLAPQDGSFDLALRGLHVIRRSRPYKGVVRDLQRPALCIVAQGSKTAQLGAESYAYDPSHLIVFSVSVPLAFQINRASADEPFLSLRLDLDPAQVAELALKVFPKGLPKNDGDRAVVLSQVDLGILGTACRLLELAARPEDAALLGPLAVEEILIRLLRSPIGPRVARLGFAKSGLPGVARAVSWLCDNYAQPMRVEALADLANMSPSSFHQHFKAATSMSPLQYQKVLRLQEARRLMLAQSLDAGSAAQLVGYLSPSQFSREYGRLFGKPPLKDVEGLREQASA